MKETSNERKIRLEEEADAINEKVLNEFRKTYYLKLLNLLAFASAENITVGFKNNSVFFALDKEFPNNADVFDFDLEKIDFNTMAELECVTYSIESSQVRRIKAEETAARRKMLLDSLSEDQKMLLGLDKFGNFINKE